MLKSILNTHRTMLYEFMEVTGLDEFIQHGSMGI